MPDGKGSAQAGRAGARRYGEGGHRNDHPPRSRDRAEAADARSHQARARTGRRRLQQRRRAGGEAEKEEKTVMATAAVSRSPDTASGCDCNDRLHAVGMRYIWAATAGILREAVLVIPAKAHGR